MSARWIRVPPEKGDDVTAALVAGVLALGVGAVAFWVTRTFLARERLPELRPEASAPKPPTGGVA